MNALWQNVKSISKKKIKEAYGISYDWSQYLRSHINKGNASR